MASVIAISFQRYERRCTPAYSRQLNRQNPTRRIRKVCASRITPAQAHARPLEKIIQEIIDHLDFKNLKGKTWVIHLNFTNSNPEIDKRTEFIVVLKKSGNKILPKGENPPNPTKAMIILDLEGEADEWKEYAHRLNEPHAMQVFKGKTGILHERGGPVDIVNFVDFFRIKPKEQKEK